MKDSGFITPTEESWRAHCLRVRGEFFDLEDLFQWKLALNNNRKLCAKDENFSIEDSPTSDSEIFKIESQKYDLLEPRGRTHIAISLPRETGAVDDMAKLYLHAADMIEKHRIENVATITSGTFFDNRPENYPYLVLWFTRPI